MYDVPFESQYEGIRDPAWQWRGCGIVALKMVMDYWHSQDARNNTVGLEELLKVGRTRDAYLEGIGWSHRGLVELAKHFGYDGYNRDHAEKGLSPKSPEASWSLLLDELKHGPVLASVFHNLDPYRGGGHIVVVTGFQDGLVSFNDPEEPNPFEGKKHIALDNFLLGFKRRFIVIRPR